MKKIAALGVAAVVLAGLTGCFGHASASGEVDMGGYIGKIENRPAKTEGSLGSPASLADWSKIPLCCQRHKHAYGNEDEGKPKE